MLWQRSEREWSGAEGSVKQSEIQSIRECPSTPTKPTEEEVEEEVDRGRGKVRSHNTKFSSGQCTPAFLFRLRLLMGGLRPRAGFVLGEPVVTAGFSVA